MISILGFFYVMENYDKKSCAQRNFFCRELRRIDPKGEERYFQKTEDLPSIFWEKGIHIVAQLA